MISNSLGVLDEAEKSALAAVPTTVKDAWIILQRNAGLLEALYLGIDLETSIGCPHCGGGFPCSSCSYPGRNFARCTHYTFGGVNLEMSIGVSYCDSMEWLCQSFIKCDHDFEDAESFLIGHIEWALSVIERGSEK